MPIFFITRQILLACRMAKIMRSWREQKILLKRWFPILSDQDFVIDSQNREGMMEGLALKLNKTRAELDLIFEELQRH